ncbi:TIGR04376 family protein [Prochlorothrix hollandica]|uniref:Phage shock protein A (IM30), suppresses sigma54-dependent transcription n=1 Tax=Prochlorothrix hollandica PCC 9006 = CALU 1027 TaxID=317619 RepID=A0A0M2PUZ7_PROHO|nr:TIGR04376 family protein [Prochlorothrix hollandica]KKJ00316.1 phage shock protein A (IM30), suppresses sigma54-dependent transcription [Prochlorothrix hollandica PCC 9006 = CALU 1027]
MSLFDDFSNFLESRLDEFLRNNPHLELQALEEQLREQEADAQQLVRDFKAKEKRVQNQVLHTAQDVKLWHQRIQKAQAAGRSDLVSAAQEREAALLRQGNQLWGQMKGLKERLDRTEELCRQIQIRRQEVAQRVAELRKTQAAAAASMAQTPASPWSDSTWSSSTTNTGRSSSPPPSGSPDPLEAQFQRWETDTELEEMKQQIGRS